MTQLPPPKPNPYEWQPRRRFRFSLRTFFVVVALLAVPTAWVAREVAIVREREEVVRLIHTHLNPYGYDFWSCRFRPPSWWESVLGSTEVPTTIQYIPVVANGIEIARVKAAFPEATVEPWPE